jgi:hypothetical protein
MEGEHTGGIGCDVGKGVSRGRGLRHIHPIILVGHRGGAVGWGPSTRVGGDMLPAARYSGRCFERTSNVRYLPCRIQSSGRDPLPAE